MLEREPKMVESEGWEWHGPKRRVEGQSWGGCLEILDFHFRAARYLQPDERYDGCVLFCETSEDMPSDDYVYQVLMGLGERGLLQRFAAVVWGRPKSWSHANRNVFGEQLLYEECQHEAVETGPGRVPPRRTLGVRRRLRPHRSPARHPLRRRHRGRHGPAPHRRSSTRDLSPDDPGVLADLADALEPERPRTARRSR